MYAESFRRSHTGITKFLPIRPIFCSQSHANIDVDCPSKLAINAKRPMINKGPSHDHSGDC